eukprot:CAMPEP_0197295624 /NCGR_PEP_ID=MMETSP0890-20130614/36061_1 /TAXON_ID=44058 ORGANISM="Aureoumbra lagunensis, Strain CCMP1510" /NCGR_SAMPLE_ID=MMETSP0890 /ASSEMBLY_ACC=CAM_ASM_000533 /LENGTH=397 /DNA_ID=CAMNT_0042771707 /DNA_START=839 /DNA_END=2032 /DNA_ORIENTATION=-
MNEEKLSETRQQKAWMDDPTYFRRVMISPTASVKMLSHAYAGCEEGMRSGGKPLEVMGMCLGCPHPEVKDAFVVSDVFPLPVTGFETRVVADDESVINYMIELSEMVEKSRKERLMGWYHSHPFDIDESHNHCFLSSTDLSTQLAWQNAEDPNGNPFLAIVIDPLRSFAKNKAEIGAFRAYPPAYSSPTPRAPDFSAVDDESTSKTVERWGNCWNRYYELHVEYFMSSQAKTIIDALNHSFLWARTLGTAPPALEPDRRSRLADRLNSKIIDKLQQSDFSLQSRIHSSSHQALPPSVAAPSLKSEYLGGSATSGTSIIAPSTSARSTGPNTQSTTSALKQENVIAKASTTATGIALEELHAQLIQSTKRALLLDQASFGKDDTSLLPTDTDVPMSVV